MNASTGAYVGATDQRFALARRSVANPCAYLRMPSDVITSRYRLRFFFLR